MAAERTRADRARVRQGRDKQRGRGAELEARRRVLAAACTRRGWRPLEPAADNGRSANQPERPGAARARLRERADPPALVAGKQERPAQALSELAGLLASAREQGFALVALTCSPQPATPPAEPRANLRASFAPCEQRLHSQRIREALARKRAEGVRLGRPATISPYAIDRIKRERAAGNSLAAIANGLNSDRIPTAQGGRRWHPSTVRYTLNRTR